jgi:hypothetical protein
LTITIPGGFDRGFIGLHGCFQLRDERAGGVVLLQRRVAGGRQPSSARQIAAGIVELRQVLEPGRLSLRDRCRERRRIDFGKHVAGLDILPFREIDLDDLTIDPRLDDDAVVGLHRTEADQVNRHVRPLDPVRGNRHRRLDVDSLGMRRPPHSKPI